MWSSPSFLAGEVYTVTRFTGWGACRKYSAKAIIEEQLQGTLSK